MRFNEAFRSHFRVGFVIACSALLVACGGDGSGTTASSTAITGTAASGDPVVGGTVALSCNNSGSANATTDSSGNWGVSVPTVNLPCVIKISGGTVGGIANSDLFFSVTPGSGSTATVNISPLTSLALASITGTTLDNTWFLALDTAGRQALLTGLNSAIADLQADLVAQGYTPPTGFDPFSVAFSAASGNGYDDLLEALKQAIANVSTTYSALLANFAAGGTLPAPAPVPPVDAPSGGDGQTGAIAFSRTGTSTAAADIASLVGVYAGTLGRVFNTGVATVDTTACTITVASNGDITVSSGSKAVTAGVNGDIGDVITGPLNGSLYKVQASDTANDRYAEITTVNGYVNAAVARNSGTGFSTATDRVECKVTNPHAATVGTLATTNVATGASAANLSSDYVGTFSNGTCTLTISPTGVFHLVSGSQDVTTSLAGDSGDGLYLFPSVDAVSMEARDYFSEGREIYISFGRTGSVFSADAAIDQPRPRVTLVPGSDCSNLVKQ